MRIKTPEQKKAQQLGFLQMYEVSGQDEISEHSFQRYLRDKEQDELIRRLQQGVEVVNSFELKKTEASLIESGLKNPNEDIRRMSARKIKDLPVDDRLVFTRMALDSTDPEVQEIAVEYIKGLPKKERGSLFEKALKSRDPMVRFSARSDFLFLSDSDKSDLKKEILARVTLGLEDHNPKNWQLTPDIFSLFSDKEKVFFIETYLVMIFWRKTLQHK